MPVDVKNLVIKSNIEQDDDSESDTSKKKKSGDPCSDLEEAKEEILNQCRRMIEDSLSSIRER
ncbi:DUF5908 family protein [Pleionea sp. CnH1-48]|uniref:DUF5908 family protein n=1 Tax=Pleionea sp. CnH1-48 TaxID=2954494 RepID=UPI002098163E|nr:DUF5908 family protein [Pleionea sp. CnH1-48]MCO7226560.1 DUF5908 family protein [Pleionea sp. CnH1-48]